MSEKNRTNVEDGKQPLTPPKTADTNNAVNSGRQDIRHKVDILTGVRPTGNLTVANYLGAVKPIIELQKQDKDSVMLFVADLHALTDSEPQVVRKYSQDLVADYLALGVDPAKTTIYLQSDLEGEVGMLTLLLARHINVGELMRVPTLKDKIKGSNPETANSLLFLYPVLMAADILIQMAKKVPVGEDQIAHLEVTREIARRFNKKYGNVIPVPEVMQVKALRIQSLKGQGKMSKTNPEGAIFLTDDLNTVSKKIKRAETAFEGKMTDQLESHIIVAKSLAKTDEERLQVDAIIEAHKDFKPVMGDFKKLFTKIVQEFIQEFQERRAEITRHPDLVPSILEQGAVKARANAEDTLIQIKEALKFRK